MASFKVMYRKVSERWKGFRATGNVTMFGVCASYSYTESAVFGWLVDWRADEFNGRSWGNLLRGMEQSTWQVKGHHKSRSCLIPHIKGILGTKGCWWLALHSLSEPFVLAVELQHCPWHSDFYEKTQWGINLLFLHLSHLFPWKQMGRLSAKQPSAKNATVTLLAREVVKLPRKKRKSFPLHCSSACLVRNQMHKTQWIPASWQHERGNCCAQLINASCLRTKILPHPANCGACPLGTEDPVHLSTCAGCTLGKGRGRL